MLVSIMMITYHHEAFVAEAIESILMQEVNFPFEIVIGDDCSKDNTRAIIESYRQKNSDIIRVLPREKNLGITANFGDTILQCRGKYVAILEGDDFWTSSTKLQKQIDYLEARPDVAVCFHSAELQYNGRVVTTIPHNSNKKDVYSLRDLLRIGPFMPTCTIVFRNKLFPAFPPWFYLLKLGDFPLHVLNAQHGNIGYIDEAMATYRTASCPTAFTAQPNSRRIAEEIKLFQTIDQFLGREYHRELGYHLFNCYLHLAVEDFVNYHFIAGIGKVLKAFKVGTFAIKPLYQTLFIEHGRRHLIKFRNFLRSIPASR